LMLWPVVVLTAVGVCFGAFAFACIVLPVLPLALAGLGVYLFVRVVVD